MDMFHWAKRWRLTLFGRSLFLISCELAANVICWVIAGILFAKTQEILGLASLAWTLGLRHGLDADHISAIDNATRGLINMNQLPVTCGLFFSLGHSTIVIAVTVAIAISTDIYDKFTRATDVGAIIGGAVSASFLFIVGFANAIILCNIIRVRRRRMGRAALDAENSNRVGEDLNELNGNKHERSIMMRMIGPVTTFVDRPWKMYPVGALFGLGFDTASSIALLAVSAFAKRGTDGKGISQGDIIILPFLFTSGMTLVDSIDSVLMLYSYSGFPERSWAIFEKKAESSPSVTENPDSGSISDVRQLPGDNEDVGPLPSPASDAPSTQPVLKVPRPRSHERGNASVHTGEPDRQTRVKLNTMSGLSIILTFMSIVVAFSIALITMMGLIGDNCGPCKKAAEAEDGGGLAGRWWRAWAKANDESGIIGAGIVGGFLVVVTGWYAGRWYLRRTRERE